MWRLASLFSSKLCTPFLSTTSPSRSRMSWGLQTSRSYCIGSLLGLVFVLLFSNSAAAAGCRHAEEDEFGDLRPGEVRVYANGVLRTFQLPELPCSGPSCRGSQPVGVATMVVVSTEDRSDVETGRHGASSLPTTDSGFAVPESADLYARLVCFDLLRPPRG